MSEKTKTGRPSRSEDNSTMIVAFRLSPAEYEAAKQRAEAEGGTVPLWARQLLLENIPAIEYTPTSAQ